jgi:hypothetical protein
MTQRVEQNAKFKNMKSCLVTIIAASALTSSVVIVRQKAHAQNASPTENSPNLVTEIPAGYRDWTMISVARVGGKLNDLRVKLGNDVAIKAYRDGTLPLPDGTIIARLAWRQVASEENNIAFRRAAERRGALPEETAKLLAESFVAGPPMNVQFMVKDSKKYAATGGWGFGQFTDGKLDNEAVHETCFSCHAPAKGHDFVFTRYAP